MRRLGMALCASQMAGNVWIMSPSEEVLIIRICMQVMSLNKTGLFIHIARVSSRTVVMGKTA